MKQLKRSFTLIMLVLGLGLSLGVTNLLIANENQPNRSQHKTGQQPRNNPTCCAQEPQADRRGTEQSPLIIKTIPTPKTEEEANREAEERQNKLSTDWWMVRFNGLLALFALLQFIWITRQVVWMRRSFATSETSASAARDAADTARQTVQTMQDTAERQLRAYIGITMAGMNLDGQSLIVRTAVQNTGLTPAYNVRVGTGFSVFEPPPHIPTFPDVDTFTNYAILGATTPLEVGARSRENFTPDTIAPVINGTRPAYYWGIVNYSDVFGIDSG